MQIQHTCKYVQEPLWIRKEGSGNKQQWKIHESRVLHSVYCFSTNADRNLHHFRLLLHYKWGLLSSGILQLCNIPKGQIPCNLHYLIAWLQINVFWKVMLCSLVGDDSGFTGNYCFHYWCRWPLPGSWKHRVHTYQTTRRHIPEDSNIHNDCHLHLKCKMFYWRQVLRWTFLYANNAIWTQISLISTNFMLNHLI